MLILILSIINFCLGASFRFLELFMSAKSLEQFFRIFCILNKDYLSFYGNLTWLDPGIRKKVLSIFLNDINQFLWRICQVSSLSYVTCLIGFHIPQFLCILPMHHYCNRECFSFTYKYICTRLYLLSKQFWLDNKQVTIYIISNCHILKKDRKNRVLHKILGYNVKFLRIIF